MTETLLSTLRKDFHSALLGAILTANDKGVPSNADKHSKPSVNIAKLVFDKIGGYGGGERLAGQTAGTNFEEICANYLKSAFMNLLHLRPGNWEICKGGGSQLALAQYEQYTHLAALAEATKKNPDLAAAIGSDYLIKPDVVVFRRPEPDEIINAVHPIVTDDCANLTSLRLRNSETNILHASVSCKWTLRSDRAQNARSEGLNLVRNRKGRLPHIVVVTGEPTPSRIASIALGTGDIDCVYHFALPELEAALAELDYEDASEMLRTMIDGKRLRDISDLPLDLVV